MNTSATLTEQITKKILDEIQNGIYKYEQRLPPEKEVALRIGVSRTVIRDALSILEREGFINRKHGIGTIINRPVLNISNRMDLKQEFSDEVRASGFTPSRKLLDVHKVKASEVVSSHLQIDLGDPVLVISSLIYADDKPAIYSIDYLATAIIIQKGYESADFNKPIFDFLREYCDTDVHIDVTEVKAIAADIEIAKNLDLPFATPVLHMQELGYTFFGKPVLYSEEYYASGIFQHTLLRKKI